MSARNAAVIPKNLLIALIYLDRPRILPHLAPHRRNQSDCRSFGLSHRHRPAGKAQGPLSSRRYIAIIITSSPNPTADCGDAVVVESVERIRFTGSKWTDKKYYSHSGYPGHLKIQRAFQLAQRDPTAVGGDTGGDWIFW